MQTTTRPTSRLFLLSAIFTFIDCSREALGPPRTSIESTWKTPRPGHVWENDRRLSPTVYIAILASNQAQVLPQFLAYIENIDYPKNRISIGIYTDHNVDETAALLENWSKNARSLYHRIDYESSNEIVHDSHRLQWTEERYVHILQLRQRSLDKARQQWADYIMFIDCDNFLIEPGVLRDLIAENKSVIAPLLRINSVKTYSNFWCGTDENGYYKRTDDYIPTLDRERIGCFPVPMIHSTILIDLRLEASENFTLFPIPSTYIGHIDDLLIFAAAVKTSKLQMYILNKEVYGYMLPAIDDFQTVEELHHYYENYKMTILLDSGEIPVSRFLPSSRVDFDNLGFSKIYMINLKRRPERRKRMISALRELKFDYEAIDAVDGQNLTEEEIEKMGIVPFPAYRDPILKRRLTRGEIGCFLSHYNIWKEVNEKELQRVLVFEDDLKFEPDFLNNLRTLLEQADDAVPDWDFIYLGRKQVYYQDAEEESVPGADMLVKPNYSYWTLSYVLSLEGARKLLAQNPLKKFLPVDEYIPIMFDTHDNPEWLSAFEPRNLNAYSAEPLLVYPTQYIGDPGYISDTEDAPPVTDNSHDEL